jgi:hypothetical protein
MELLILLKSKLLQPAKQQSLTGIPEYFVPVSRISGMRRKVLKSEFLIDPNRGKFREPNRDGRGASPDTIRRVRTRVGQAIAVHRCNKETLPRTNRRRVCHRPIIVLPPQEPARLGSYNLDSSSSNYFLRFVNFFRKETTARGASFSAHKDHMLQRTDLGPGDCEAVAVRCASEIA